MAVTEGGFPAGLADHLGVRQFTVPGTKVDFPGGIAAFAAPLLLWVAKRIHEDVEPLRDGWCWGYAFRDVRGGSTVLSDHAGGVAIDINAPAHPRGVRGTWSDHQVRQIRAILAEANRHATVVAWGHDFRTTVDDMHFACRGTREQVINAGARLNQPREWDEMASKAEIREVVDNALAAARSDIAAAVTADVTAKAADPASELGKAIRARSREAVDNELDQRGIGV